jgi:hypothetical protein
VFTPKIFRYKGDYANIAVFSSISNTKRQYPLYIFLEGAGTTGAIMPGQLVTIDYSRPAIPVYRNSIRCAFASIA